ncbi:rhamnogalacturonan acetylesterase [Streptomyces sp. Je 1-79]|uniref:rhamnogalacturonan acetylesterase n=1 Tax=Streptomyces sp. Je 1-79 TaxID=2943847 RepID=UPI0021A63A81|nr:rhamnogalacturonan acetylesterase [Streptomyces sp. Je 1-79]MCT4352366.1 rhamnogalacturonan acetylesterase [Streptomyces sp. Je 1-79]
MRRIFIAGGSGACTRQTSMAPMAGWGQVLHLFTPGAEVVNAARAGASSRSFWERGRLAWILENIAPGDLLLVSFGHNDMRAEDGRFSAPFSDFQFYLKKYISGARSRGAHPVLVPGVERRVFDAFGNMRRSLGVYPQAVRELAQATSVPLVDLHDFTCSWWEQLGSEESKNVFLYLRPGEHPNYPEGVEDNSHVRPHGALECARFVAREMYAQGLLLPECFRNLDAHIPEQEVTWLPDDVFEHLTKSRVSEVVR